MGVPALFRWLSKKYPKIVLPVVEEEESKVSDADGNQIPVPIDISKPNPNLMEFDNLYLDMNGIVHPCTHPEGKPAPETEEDMMVEIFSYTDRIVNMIRPRKLLFMAIDGVAPRAKMNQQRSRRFRASQEAKEKEQARKEAIAMFEAMGHPVTDDTKEKNAWDSNAITPGTPFMDLLAAALRYWVVQKTNTDPGWKNLQVIISDASVPGEGEHKIMDFIRRQRTNLGHDPNTRHVIYGLDADLIMLSLATHEPHFRVLREDVFHQEGSRTACRICGQEGHYAAQCTGEKKIMQDKDDVKNAPEKKPFIFLDVAILREYLEVELKVPQAPFAFDFERAIDDWVLLIFFVGNDFLPHLPSLEIREGGIDTLLRIWRDELPRMGGYLTNHGKVELARAGIILEGLARREDDIFRRRREAEERQDQNAKRQKLEHGDGNRSEFIDSGMSMSDASYAPVTASVGPPIHPSLPPRPSSGLTPMVNPLQPIRSSDPQPQSSIGRDSISMTSNHDVVANRRAIRMANMNAAEMLKAELAGRAIVQTTSTSLQAAETIIVPPVAPAASDIPLEPPPLPLPNLGPSSTVEDFAHTEVLPGLRGSPHAGPDSIDSTTGVAPSSMDGPSIPRPPSSQLNEDAPTLPEMPPIDMPSSEGTADVINGGATNDASDATANQDDAPRGTKRKADDVERDDESVVMEESEAADEAPDEADVPSGLALKVNPDGTAEQEDTVKLWEPGYKERYYKQKFGVESSDIEFKKQLTKCYVEGLSWVLHYYYQGTPSWQWFYPYHYAPFAADFEEVSKMEIKFKLGQPFKAFEQLMGVFPAASRKHIPETFQSLMVDEDSPIIDFYPTTFDIDMNGKKMAWQGVALLPFIDEKRLLDAMAPRYKGLTGDEIQRNKWGTSVLYVGREHALHSFLSGLYVKRKKNDPVVLDTKLTQGIAGSALPDPQCLPDSMYFSPFEKVPLSDIPDNRTLSCLYYYPRQLQPHRSQLLPGVRRPIRILTSADFETLYRRGGRGRGRGGGPIGWGPPRGNFYGGHTYAGNVRDRGAYGYSTAPPGGHSNGSSSWRGGYGSTGYGQSHTGYGQYYGGGRDYANHGLNGGYAGYGARGVGRGGW